MDPDTGAQLRSLLSEQTVLALAVVVDGDPVVGQVPFALSVDWSALYVLTSSLALHSQGLAEHSRFAALIPEVGADALDPFQRSRLTLQGSVSPLAHDSREWTAAREIYIERLPTGARLFSLADFTLNELLIERGRYVGGFAAAHTVTPEILRRLAPS